MVRLLRSARSVVALLALLASFGLGGLVQRVFVTPLVWLRPRRRIAIMSAFMQFMAAWVLVLVRGGGARFGRTGRIPTDRPTLILMNHQSLVDIPTAIRLCRPSAPAFVTRRRYARFIPMVSPMLALRKCPIVDPEGAPRAAVRTLRNAAWSEDHGILIFPEGHRSKDGEIGPFDTAGIRVILRARAMPVYLIVTDGFWLGRRLGDFATNMHAIRGSTEALGPFDPPASEPEMDRFVESLRGIMVARLKALRESRA
jgi:1-acyl-sn-glycerol-3-phosphate acyltransferase